MTSQSRACIVFADVYEDLKLAYQGKNGYGGDVAEIYACRLVGPQRSRPTTNPSEIRDWTDADSQLAADNLRLLCIDLLTEFPDAEFCLGDTTIDISNVGRNPFVPFSHRTHLRVRPRTVDDPKVCVTLGWKFGSGSRRKFRVIVDGTYVTVEDQREDRLGQPFWMPYDDSRGVGTEKLLGTALGAIVRGELERSYRQGVIYIDIPGDFEEED